MSLPALDDIAGPDRRGDPHRDITAGEGHADHHGDDAVGVPARQVFGEYCTVNDYVDCPPDELFEYLSDTRSLEEWTYSLRGFTPTDEPGLWLAHDRLGPRDRDLHPHRCQPRTRARSTTTAPGTRASTCG